MEVNVRLGYGIAPQAGSARLSVALPEQATVADLVASLRRLHPELDSRLEVALPVISGRHVSPEEQLAPGQEVAFLLPIAGGSYSVPV